MSICFPPLPSPHLLPLPSPPLPSPPLPSPPLPSPPLPSPPLPSPPALPHQHTPSTSASIPSRYQTFFHASTESRGFNSQATRFQEHLNVVGRGYLMVYATLRSMELGNEAAVWILGMRLYKGVRNEAWSRTGSYRLYQVSFPDSTLHCSLASYPGLPTQIYSHCESFAISFLIDSW